MPRGALFFLLIYLGDQHLPYGLLFAVSYWGRVCAVTQPHPALPSGQGCHYWEKLHLATVRCLVGGG